LPRCAIPALVDRSFICRGRTAASSDRAEACGDPVRLLLFRAGKPTFAADGDH